MEWNLEMITLYAKQKKRHRCAMLLLEGVVLEGKASILSPSPKSTTVKVISVVSIVPASDGLLLQVCVLNHFSHVCLYATPWTGALQPPLSVGFSSKNTGVGCPVLQGIILMQGSNSISCTAGGPVTSEPRGKTRRR